jgi:hypothetical protein
MYYTGKDNVCADVWAVKQKKLRASKRQLSSTVHKCFCQQTRSILKYLKT